MGLNSRNVSSVQGVVVSHQWLFGYWKSFACLLHRIFFLKRWTNAQHSWGCSDSLLRMLPHKFFLWHFLLVMFHMCFFLCCPHAVFTTNFPLSVPSHTQFHWFLSSSDLRKIQTATCIFVADYGKKKKGLLPKGYIVCIKGLIFSRTFSSLRSPLFALGKIRIYALSLLVGPLSHFLTVDWFSHHKFLIMSQ